MNHFDITCVKDVVFLMGIGVSFVTNKLAKYKKTKKFLAHLSRVRYLGVRYLGLQVHFSLQETHPHQPLHQVLILHYQLIQERCHSLPHQKSLQHLLTSTPRRRTTDCQTRLPSERLPSPPHHHHHGRSSPQIHQPSPTPILSFIQPTDKRSCTQRFPSIPSLPLQTHLQDTRTTRHQSHPLISHYSPQPPYQDEDHTAHSTDS